MYAFYGLFALTSLINAEITIRDLGIVPSSTIDSTGQVIALVIALATFFRVCWLFVFLFLHEDSKKLGLSWPFHMRVLQFSNAPKFVKLPPSEWPSPDLLPLGSMLRDPRDITSKYEDHVLVPERDQKRIKKQNYSRESEGIFSRGFELCGFGCALEFRRREEETAHSIEEMSFTPSEAFLRECAAKSEIQREFGAGTRCVTVYIVVDMRVATGISIMSSGESHFGVNTGIGAPYSVARDRPVKESKNEGCILHSYSVREYIFTSDGPSLYSVRVNGG
jgi:hypothetical protein